MTMFLPQTRRTFLQASGLGLGSVALNLLLDLNKGIEKGAAKTSSYVVFAASILITIYFGWRLW